MATREANGTTTVRTEELLGVRARRDYNAQERRFSALVFRRLDELLQGDRNELMILRVYPNAPERLGVMGTPPRIDRTALRLPMLRRILEDVLLFLYTDSPGGPTAQQVEAGDRIVERRHFPTKYPHIVIEREDVFAPSGDCQQTTWYACRVQNQRSQTQINRLLDVANLGFEVVGALLR